MIRTLACLLLLASTSIPNGATEPDKDTKAQAQFAVLPLAFEANRGQAAGTAQFIARGPGYSLFLTREGAVLALGADRGSVVRMQLAGARAADLAGEQALAGRVHYLVDRDPKRWTLNVPLFARVRGRGVYPGIDVVYYGNQRRLEYDFVVAPGADPRPIALRVAGADRLEVQANGDLLIRSGKRVLRWSRPVSYQVIGGERREVASKYSVSGNQIRFALGAYDPRQELVIDPSLVYSTYLGGSTDADPFIVGEPQPGTAYNRANGIAVDGTGHAYVSGVTSALDFPATSGAYDTTQNGSGCNPHGGSCISGFVTKLNASGSALVYSTYFGSGVVIEDLAVSSTGRAYIVGHFQAGLEGVPTTSSAYQGPPECEFCSEYSFLAVLNESGSGLVYSTYFGSADPSGQNGDTYANEVAVGATGVAYMIGSTTAPDLPTTSDGFQRSLGGGWDAFVAKIDPSKTGSASLHWASYFGGGKDEHGAAIATEGGRMYITGSTMSDDLPTTAGAFDRDRSYNADAFVAKLNSNLSGASSLVYSTFIGGTRLDRANDLALRNGEVYVAGSTLSPNLPVTSSAFDRTGGCSDGNPCWEGWVAKLNASGSALGYLTYLQGSWHDHAVSIAVDGNGNAVVLSVTLSPDFPTTADAFDRNTDGLGCFSNEKLGECSDAVLTKLNPAGSALIYSTYFGGTDDENPQAVAVDGAGDAYLTGYTNSPDLPTTSGAYDRTRTGAQDAFVAKFRLGSSTTCSTPATSRTINLCEPQDGATVSSPVRVLAKAYSSVGVKYSQVYVDGVRKHHVSGATVDASIAMAAGTRRVTVQSKDNADVLFKKTVYITVK